MSGMVVGEATMRAYTEVKSQAPAIADLNAAIAKGDHVECDVGEVQPHADRAAAGQGDRGGAGAKVVSESEAVGATVYHEDSKSRRSRSILVHEKPRGLRILRAFVKSRLTCRINF
jgi:hypothetical protein